MVRRLLASVAATATAVGVLIALPAVASAATPIEQCHASGTETVTPGVTNTARFNTLVVKNGKLTKCAGASTANATFTAKLSGKISCSAGVTKGTLTTPFAGHANTANITLRSVSGKPGQVTINGQFVNGPAKGHKVGGALTFSPANAGANCTTVPITKATFTGTFKVF